MNRAARIVALYFSIAFALATVVWYASGFGVIPLTVGAFVGAIVAALVLEAVARFEQQEPVGDPRAAKEFLILVTDATSSEFRLWWKPNRAGNSCDVDKAGVYTKEEWEQARTSELALWWKPNAAGYTCNVDEAGLYTKEEWERVVPRDLQSTNVLVPERAVDTLAVPVVLLRYAEEAVKLAHA